MAFKDIFKNLKNLQIIYCIVNYIHMSFEQKYIKYKTKYLELKSQLGGSLILTSGTAAAHIYMLNVLHK
jgi:hypothetical protein